MWFASRSGSSANAGTKESAIWRETFDAFLQLPAPQRKLIREVILTFAKAHQDGAAPHDAPAGKASPE